MNIDLVYLWCDGSQPKMREKRLKAERELGIVRDESVNGKCRYVSTDELRFSLRSVELHAPWIRRIFIVVDDDQILPRWLKTEGTKITIVRHSEIMPPKMMPIFNSMAISFRIPFIKGLSECFLYANDDMMIFRDVSPEYFFTAEGHPIVYHFEARNKDGRKTQYHRLLINCEHAVTEAFGVNEELSRVIGRWPHHNVQGFCKSHWLECHKLFHKQIEATCHSRFRADDNLEEWLFSCYALAIGEGEARLARDLAGELGPAFSSSLMFNRREHWGQFEERLKTYNPYLFCVNDNDRIRDEDRLRMKDCLGKVFAIKNEPLRVLIATNSGANRITANTFVATLAGALRSAGAEVDCGIDLFWNVTPGLYDIVHLQWPEALIGWNAAKATDEFLRRLRERLAELKSAGTKIVYTRHNRKPHKLSGENIGKLTEIFETEADAIVHMGETSKRECLKAYPNSAVRHVVIPHHLKDEINFSISREEARTKLGIAADAKVMLAFGAFRHEEEVALLNGAVKDLHVPNFKLLAPLCPGDTYKGLVPDDELPAYFAAADIVFLQRVKVLNSGVLPLAYDAARVCVGPSDGNAGEILANTDNPTFDPNDRASVVAAIKRGFALAAEDKGEANRVYARERWTPKQIAETHLALYRELRSVSTVTKRTLPSEPSRILLKAWLELVDGKPIMRNWGDELNWFLLKRLTTLPIEPAAEINAVKSDEIQLLFIGSGADFCNFGENSVVWGSGSLREGRKIKSRPHKICAVRGPLTRAKFLEAGIACPEVYGDPALLLPRVYQPNVGKRYKMGIAVHFREWHLPHVEEFRKEHPEILFIDMGDYGKWTEIPDKICSCEALASSSLHALIVADAYQVPNVLIKFSDLVKGGTWKFRDYFAGVSRKFEEPLDFTRSISLGAINASVANYRCIRYDADKFMSVAPFPVTIDNRDRSLPESDSEANDSRSALLLRARLAENALSLLKMEKLRAEYDKSRKTVKKLRIERDRSRKELKAVKNSAAYRVGLLVTWPARKLWRAFRDNPKVDAWFKRRGK